MKNPEPKAAGGNGAGEEQVEREVPIPTASQRPSSGVGGQSFLVFYNKLMYPCPPYAANIASSLKEF